MFLEMLHEWSCRGRVWISTWIINIKKPLNRDARRNEKMNTHLPLPDGIKFKVERDLETGELIAVLEDETENYSFGKVSLNDYISAVNVLDSHKFNQIEHDVQYRKSIIELLRLTDQLVDRKDIL